MSGLDLVSETQGICCGDEQMSSVETRQMSQQQSSVLSQQQTSVLSQQKTSILSQQKTRQLPAAVMSSVETG